MDEGYPSRAQDSAGLKRDHFIGLIHPIQWTIALLVGATGPTKCQKRRPLYTPPAGPVTECAFARWHIILPFFVWRVECADVFFTDIFQQIQPFIEVFIISTYFY